MSAISTTMHHHSLWPRLRHSATRSGETSPLRLARLIADLTNGINQHSPSVGSPGLPLGPPRPSYAEGALWVFGGVRLGPRCLHDRARVDDEFTCVVGRYSEPVHVAG
jgi:hypothetical protein